MSYKDHLNEKLKGSTKTFEANVKSLQLICDVHELYTKKSPYTVSMGDYGVCCVELLAKDELVEILNMVKHENGHTSVKFTITEMGQQMMNFAKL